MGEFSQPDVPDQDPAQPSGKVLRDAVIARDFELISNLVAINGQETWTQLWTVPCSTPGCYCVIQQSAIDRLLHVTINYDDDTYDGQEIDFICRICTQGVLAEQTMSDMFILKKLRALCDSDWAGEIALACLMIEIVTPERWSNMQDGRSVNVTDYLRQSSTGSDEHIDLIIRKISERMTLPPAPAS